MERQKVRLKLKQADEYKDMCERLVNECLLDIYARIHSMSRAYISPYTFDDVMNFLFYLLDEIDIVQRAICEAYVGAKKISHMQEYIEYGSFMEKTGQRLLGIANARKEDVNLTNLSEEAESGGGGSCVRVVEEAAEDVLEWGEEILNRSISNKRDQSLEVDLCAEDLTFELGDCNSSYEKNLSLFVGMMRSGK